MKMDKIKEAFEKAFNLTEEYLIDTQEERAFILGFKAANLLPTEIDCPECDENGYYIPRDGIGLKGIYKCPVRGCKNGKIQIYYTPEEFKTIMGYDYPDDAYVLVYLLGKWIFELYGRILDEYKSVCVIVQTAQKCPGADYRREG